MVAVHDDETAAAVDDEPDPETEIPAVNVEPDPDDGDVSDDRIELVRTGLIRVWVNGTRYRMRRPFFGEFKTIRLSLADVNDEIAEASDEALRVARVVRDEMTALEESTPDEWVAARKKFRAMTNDANRAFADLVDDARMRWWEDTWTTLSVDGPPSDWPSWVTDPALPNRLITHWRSSPLGRG